MKGVCSVELLKSALAGNLSADEEAVVADHLEQCESCIATMENMAAEPAFCHEAAMLLAADALDESVRLSEDWSHIDFGVEFLEPTDDPSHLGRLGGYDITQVIGRGGMGVVLKGFDSDLKRYVAIKVLAPHLAHSSLARKRFAREAQAAAAVVHPHVLAIHQVQPNGRLPYFVMPLVVGQSLAERLAAQGLLDMKEVLRIGMQAAAGLAAAHEQGLVHRDVKPANILLECGVERAVLTDFGLARAADDVSMTRWGIIAGTPQYMSPEQACGGNLDYRSDLFSLGCVLYEMATGVSPFKAESTIATLHRLVDDRPLPLDSLNSELPHWFISIVDRLLEKDPSRRFGSATEVSELLAGCLAHIQQPATTPLPAGLVRPTTRSRSFLPKSLKTGVLVMLGTIGLIFAGMIALQVGVPPAVPGNDDSLEGVWELVLPPEIAAKGPDDQRLHLVFAGGFHASYQGSQPTRQMAYRLRVDPKQSPKRLWLDGENPMRGIYEVKGDGLRLSIAPDAEALPTKFGTEHPEFKRVKGDKARELLDALNMYRKKASDSASEPDLFETETAKKPMNSDPKSVLVLSRKREVQTIAYSADGKMIAMAYGNPPSLRNDDDDDKSQVEDDGEGTYVHIFVPQKKMVMVRLKFTTSEEDAVLAATERSPTFEIKALAFSPDSSLLAIGTSVGQVKLFNTQNGTPVRSLDDAKGKLTGKGTPKQFQALPRAMGSVKSLAFSPDGLLLATCGGSFDDAQLVLDEDELGRLSIPNTGPGRVKVWELKTGMLKHDLNGLSDANAVAFSPNGELLVSAGRWFGGDDHGHGVILWDPRDGLKVLRVSTPTNAGTHGVAFSPDSKLLAIVSIEIDNDKLTDAASGVITLARTGSGLVEWRVTVPGGTDPVAFSPDGKSIAILHGRRTITFLDPATGKTQQEINVAASQAGSHWNDFAISPNSRELAIAGGDQENKGFVDLWRLVTPFAPEVELPTATKLLRERTDLIFADLKAGKFKFDEALRACKDLAEVDSAEAAKQLKQLVEISETLVKAGAINKSDLLSVQAAYELAKERAKKQP
jgi:uncharacterized protein (TIGR03067 family)